MADAYAIAVKISMQNGVSSVLRVIQRDVLGLNQQVDFTQKGLNRLKLAAAGGMAATVGVAGMMGFAKLIEAGAKVQNQQQLMLAAGISNQQVAEATAAAWQTTAKVMGTGVVDNMKAVQDLRIAFASASANGNVALASSDAIKYMPLLQQAKMVVQAQLGQDSGDQVYDYAKSLEMIGATMDPKRFATLLDAMTKASLASGGRVSGAGFFSAIKYGRSAAQGWGDDFIGDVLPLLIQEMGGGGGGSGGPGNALMSAYQTVVAGKMSNKAAEEFAKFHLLNKGSVIYTTTGDVKGVRAGGVKGSDLFQDNPYQWVQQVLMPALKAQGVTDPAAIRQDIAYLFGNRTASQIMDMFATQQARFQGSAALNDNAQGIGAWGSLVNQNLSTNWQAFVQALVGTPDNPGGLVAVLGLPLVPKATAFLHELTVHINEFVVWASSHQAQLRIAEEVILGLSVAMTVLGGIAVVSAIGAMIGSGGTLALVAAGVVGVAAAFGLLAAGIKELELAFPSLFPSADHTHMHLSAPVGRFHTRNWTPDAGWQQVGGQIVAMPGPPPFQRPLDPREMGRGGDVYLDGKKVGNILWRGLKNQLTAPQTGSSTANYRLTPSGSAAATAR